MNNFLAESFPHFESPPHIVSHSVVAEGHKGSLPAQLIRYKAVGSWASSGDAERMCGIMAIAYDQEWKTFRFMVGVDYMDQPGAKCSDDPRTPRWMGNMKLSAALKSKKWDLVLPGVPAVPDPPPAPSKKKKRRAPADDDDTGDEVRVIE